MSHKWWSVAIPWNINWSWVIGQTVGKDVFLKYCMYLLHLICSLDCVKSIYVAIQLLLLRVWHSNSLTFVRFSQKIWDIFNLVNAATVWVCPAQIVHSYDSIVHSCVYLVDQTTSDLLWCCSNIPSRGSSWFHTLRKLNTFLPLRSNPSQVTPDKCAVPYLVSGWSPDKPFTHAVYG